MSPKRVPLRRLLLVLPIAAIPIVYWGQVLAARRSGFLQKAAAHERDEAREHRMLEEIEAHRRNGVAWKSERSGAMAEEARRLREPHYAALKEKYQRAAYRPWETPAPDPPDPGEKLVQEAWTTQMTESLTVEPFEARLDQFDVPMPQKLEPIPTGKPTPAKGRPTGRAKSES